ncbi:MAG: TetR family transcriptional regulator, partial [Pseudomonadota bacterium]
MATGRRPSKRAARKAETNKKLIQASWDLFAEKGFDNVTVNDIANAAGVSRRTFFRYYPSKEAVIFYLHTDHLALFRRLREEARGKPDLGRADFYRLLLEVGKSCVRERENFFRAHRLIGTSPALAAKDRSFDGDWEQEMLGALKQFGTLPEGLPDAHMRLQAALLVGGLHEAA